jgi:hypothetical protein
MRIMARPTSEKTGVWLRGRAAARAGMLVVPVAPKIRATP